MYDLTAEGAATLDERRDAWCTSRSVTWWCSLCSS